MALIKSGSTATYADVDANKNLKSNTYYAAPAVVHGTFGATTTVAAAGGRINCTGYKYIKIFVSATMTTNAKNIGIPVSGSHTIAGSLYPIQNILKGVTGGSINDIIGAAFSGTNLASAEFATGVYASSIDTEAYGVSFKSKTTGTDYVIRGNMTLSLLGFLEIQLYIQHDDTGTINTTIDYVLFNS